jgi:flagellar basal-body rod protein FlgB
MISKLDKHFGFNETAMRLRGQRQELLAANIANADTPYYKAVDFEFDKALIGARQQQNRRGFEMTRTEAGHLAGFSKPAMQYDIKYRVEQQPSIDGNTVDMNQELANFSDNAIRFQASITFMSQRVRGMQTAISGQ